MLWHALYRESKNDTKLLLEVAIVKGKFEQKLSKSRAKTAQFWQFLGLGIGVEKLSIFTAKVTSLHESMSFRPLLSNLVKMSGPGDTLEKIFHISHIGGTFCGCNQLCQILFQSVVEF